MHRTRSEIPKTWPVPRKGTKYLIAPSHGFSKGIPVLLALRDMLKVVQKRKEAKLIINQGKVLVNGNKIRDENYSMVLFDTLTLEGKSYRLTLDNKKFSLDEISGKEAEEKIVKIISQKLMNKGKIQINLSDGRNFISSEKLKVGDSVVYDLKQKKSKKTIALKTGSKVFSIKGKHLGNEGTVESIDDESKIAVVKFDKEKANVELNNLMALN